MAKYLFELPIKVISEANCCDRWAKHKRKKIHKGNIDVFCRQDLLKVILPCKVTFTRKAPRFFDDDNLPSAFKWMRDRIAQILFPGTLPGKADNRPTVKWIYQQEKSSTNLVVIEIVDSLDYVQ